MSPPDDCHTPVNHVQSVDHGVDDCRSRHGVNDLLSVTNWREDHPLNVAGATRVRLEMIELERQLARLRLRCRELVYATSETSTAAAGTTTSADTVFPGSTERDGPRTPPRRVAVPRMGIHRRSSKTPFSAEMENTIGETNSADVREVINDSTNPADAECRRRLRWDRSTNCSHGKPVKDITRATPESESTNTSSLSSENVWILPHSSPSSDDATDTSGVCCDNAGAIIRCQHDSGTAEQSNSCSDVLNSIDAGQTECDLPSNSVDNVLANNNFAVRRQLSTAANIAGVSTPSTIDPNNAPTVPRRLNYSSSTDRAVANGRSPGCRRVREIGDASSGEAAFRSGESVSRCVDRSSQTEDADMVRRRQELYRCYANVMYTNPDNLRHTISVQQALYRQQLGGPVDSRAPVASDRTTLASSDGATMEWVVKRRADGSRYITRRPARGGADRRAKRRRNAEDLRRRRRQVETTTDDGNSELLKAGRYWTRDERRKQVRDIRVNGYSINYLIPHRPFPIGGPLEPSLCF